MTIKYKTKVFDDWHVEKKKRPVKVEDEIICDICGAVSKIENGFRWNEYCKEHGGTYNTFEASIHCYKSTTMHHGMNDKLDMDICPECFIKKVYPFLVKLKGGLLNWEYNYAPQPIIKFPLPEGVEIPKPIEPDGWIS